MLFRSVVVVLSGLFAMARGFVREVLSLASWVGAALVTLWGFGIARPYARTLIESTLLADIVTGVALFICSLVLFSMIGGGIASLVRGTGLNALDRTLGFLFGRGLCFVLVSNFQSDLYRIPLVLTPGTHALAAALVLASTVVSGLVVRHRLDHLDLVACLGQVPCGGDAEQPGAKDDDFHGGEGCLSCSSVV